LYPYFKNGEIWSDVKEELEDMNCQPCSDDAHWMETMIEETEEQAIQAAVVQTKLYEESQVSQQKELDNYFAGVRIKAQINAGGSKGG